MIPKLWIAEPRHARGRAVARRPAFSRTTMRTGARRAQGWNALVGTLGFGPEMRVRP
jgi:hypothetical protein